MLNYVDRKNVIFFFYIFLANDDAFSLHQNVILHPGLDPPNEWIYFLHVLRRESLEDALEDIHKHLAEISHVLTLEPLFFDLAE